MTHARLAMAFVMTLATSARAETSAAVELDREDAPAGRTELGFDGGAPVVGWGLSLGLGYFAHPLVLTKDVDLKSYEISPVARRMTAVLGGALAVGEHVVIDVRLPFARQIGRGLMDFGQGPLERWVIGDTRVAVRTRIAGDNAQGVFVRTGLVFPTGDETAFAGEAGAVALLSLIGRVTATTNVVIAGNVGVRIRNDETMIGNTIVGNELVGSFGVVMPLATDLHASAEVDGSLGDSISGIDGPAPIEGRIGVQLVAYKGMEIGFRLGAGFVDELGSPKWRATFEIAWSGDWNVGKYLPAIGHADDDDDE